jgi:Cof subfamily protein (haloacid dehalogenase superfamily)
MIKLIASDIDGTLVPDGTAKIDPRMFDIIKRLKEKGIIYVGASGRQFASMARLFAPVSEDIYYITEGGTVLRDTKKVYDMNVFDRDILMEMIKDVKKLPDCDIMLSGLDTAYCEDKSEMFYWMRDSYRFNIKVLGDFETHLTDDIVKLSIYHKDNAEAIVNEWFTDKWKDKFKIASAGVMWMDVTGLTADKGNSLKRLQAILGITREETMAFGDNLNDLGLLDAAEESYAIGSARDEVKKAAKHVAPPLDEFGESEVLLQLLKELEV